MSIVVGWTSFDLLRSALHPSLDGVPGDVEVAAVERWLRAKPGVADLHDLHVWPLSTTQIALTVHLVMPEGSPGDGFLDKISDELEHEFHISHSTIQIERNADPPCRLASAAIP